MQKRPTKRVFFKEFSSAGKFPDGRARLDVYFQDSEGNTFIWTPEWERGTRAFFIEAYRVGRLNVPEGPEVARFRGTAQQVVSEEVSRAGVNFKLFATDLGEGMKYTTTVNQVGRMASAIFSFPCVAHPHPSISSSRSQLVYDWVMTLSEQPMPDSEKVRLLREFVDAIVPVDAPIKKKLAGI